MYTKLCYNKALFKKTGSRSDLAPWMRLPTCVVEATSDSGLICWQEQVAWWTPIWRHEVMGRCSYFVCDVVPYELNAQIHELIGDGKTAIF